jgi:hypothetical protein
VTQLLLAALLAYIPSAGSLLRKAAERAQALGRTREVSLSGTLTVTGSPAHAAQLVLRFPLQCTIQEEGAPSLSVKAGAAEGTTGPALQLLQLACPLLTFRNVPKDKDDENAIRGAAISAGIDLAGGSALSRLVDRAVFVLGAGPRDTARPQLWLYKDTHAPARLIAQSGADLRLLEYGNPAAADWFPRVIELWTSGQLAARFEVLEAKGVRGSGEEADDSE